MHDRYRPKLTRRHLATLAVAATAPPWRAARADAPVVLGQVIPLSGDDARLGDDWRNGVEMAVQDINAAGGIQGLKIQVTTYNSLSSAAGLRDSLRRALEGDHYALLGPLTEADVLASQPALRDRRLLQVVRANVPAAPHLFMAGAGEAGLMTRLVRWMGTSMAGITQLGVLWHPGERGRRVREALAEAARQAGISLAGDISLSPAPAEPAGDVARLLRASPQAVFLAPGAADAARLLTELRRQAPDMKVLGTAALLARPVLEKAGAAAVGVRAIAGLAADAPELAGFRDRFQARFKQPPSMAAMEGQIAVGMVKAASDRLGRTDPRALPDGLRGQSFTAAEAPALLLDTRWNAAGEPERICFLGEVTAPGQVRWQSLPRG
jgi:branched-chain amino acid transport system substrate-binding protein